MFSAETKRNVLIEYPLEISYDTLINLFPYRVYRLDEYDNNAHTISVKDESNYTFKMFIFLEKNSSNTTLVTFIADYPHAMADMTKGGEKAINNILEGFLNELDKKPKPELSKEDKTALQNSDIEVLNSKNFINPVNSETNTKTIAAGYILFLLTFILPIISLNINNGQSPFSIFLMIGSILCFSFFICIPCILIYSENRKSVLHGRIQTCMGGVLFIIAGLLIHMSLAIAGILIPATIIGYSIKKEKDDIRN